jgi:periplasmic protein TonB
VRTPFAAASTAAPAPATAAKTPALAPSPSSVARPAPIERAASPEVSAARAVPAMAADLPGAAPLVPSPPVAASVVRPAAAPAAPPVPSRPVAAAQSSAAVPAQDVPVARVPDHETPRPRPRTAGGERVPPRQAEARTPARQPTPQGHAAETARAGDARGAVEGNATRTQAGSGGQAESDGRAAAEYPQRVNRHLVRLRRPATRFAGAAVVSFTIAEGGGLAALSIARSSGNAEFDRIALAHVQRAAPFPPPPAGAQRRFNVTVQGR